MVNIPVTTSTTTLRRVTGLVGLYVALVIGTVVALGVLSAVAPQQATAEA